MKERGFALAREWMAPGQQLVKQDAQRPHVGAVVELVTAGLLGRHVGERSETHAGPREVGELASGQAEVEDLHFVIVGDQNVRRLDVAMDDAELMGMSEAARDLRHDGDGVLDRERSLLHALRQRSALIERHGEEEAAVTGLADVEDGADVRMIESRGRARLGEQAPRRLFRRRANGAERRT